MSGFELGDNIPLEQTSTEWLRIRQAEYENADSRTSVDNQVLSAIKDVISGREN